MLRSLGIGGGKSLEGRTVLVTGAGGGIGREIAQCFAEAGAAHIVLWDLNAESMEGAAQVVRALGAAVSCYEVDLCDCQAVYSATARVRIDLVQEIESRRLPDEGAYVSVLVNNAGLGSSGQSLLDTCDERIRKMFEVNALALFWTVKAFLPQMRERGAGHIVTVASMQGHIGLPRMADYSASKHAAVGFTESLRRELLHDGFTGIGASLICPCHVETQMFKGYRQPLIPSLTPKVVGQAVVDAVRYGQAVVILPPVSVLFAVLNKCLPAILVDELGRLLRLGHGADDLDRTRTEECLALMDRSQARPTCPRARL